MFLTIVGMFALYVVCNVSTDPSMVPLDNKYRDLLMDYHVAISVALTAIIYFLIT